MKDNDNIKLMFELNKSEEVKENDDDSNVRGSKEKDWWK